MERGGAHLWRAALSGLSALVLAVGMSLAAPPPADAYTYFKASKPGKVVVLDQVQGTHYQICVGYVVIDGIRYPVCTWNPALLVPQTRIARSPATKAAQKLTVTWQLQRYDNGWYTHTQQSWAYNIPKGKNSVRTTTWFPIPTKALYMRMVLRVKWKSAKTGKTLGSYRAVFNEARDYRCATRFPCQVMADSIWLKSPGT